MSWGHRSGRPANDLFCVFLPTLSTIFVAVARGFLFSGGPQEKKGRGGPLPVGIAAFTCRHTAPYHPQPTGGLCQAPCGSGGHCRGRGLPQGDHNGPKEVTAGPRHNSSTLSRPRPVGHQSTPWPHQTPTKHPRGPAHHPSRLWWPWAASGVANRLKTGPWAVFNAFRPGWVWPGS